MPNASAASVVRRRNAVSLATSALCHALIFALGALLLTRSGKPAAAENVEVALVEAKPDPIRDVAATPPDKPPAPTMPVAPRTSIARAHPKSPARAKTVVPEIAVSPATEVATASDVALPAAAETAPRKDEIVPSSGLPSAAAAPARRDPGPITVVATPRYRSNPRPEYPIASRRRHEEGEVRLTVTVSPDGRPLQVSLSRSSGHPLLDQASVAAVRGWTFEPARASGIPVTSQVLVPVRWSLSQE
jgi:protein TonB